MSLKQTDSFSDEPVMQKEKKHLHINLQLHCSLIDDWLMIYWLIDWLVDWLICRYFMKFNLLDWKASLTDATTDRKTCTILIGSNQPNVVSTKCKAYD